MFHLNLRTSRRIPAITQVSVFVLFSMLADCTANSQDFNRDIRPILASHCFACHGPDASHRESDLRFDLRESPIESSAITPGDPEASEMITRVTSDDPQHVMPPPEVGQQLSQTQIAILKSGLLREQNMINTGRSSLHLLRRFLKSSRIL